MLITSLSPEKQKFSVPTSHGALPAPEGPGTVSVKMAQRQLASRALPKKLLHQRNKVEA
ncbi:MAG: hypothetical protein ACK5TM_15235 [Methylobacterium sp.]